MIKIAWLSTSKRLSIVAQNGLATHVIAIEHGCVN